VFDVDIHAHTRFFHWSPGEPTAYDPLGATLLAAASRRSDIDGVALTNHDYYEPFAAGAAKPQFIPGIEVTTTQGHALVVGPDPPTRTTPGSLTPREIVARAHDADCAVVIPHPFRHGSIHESGAAFDAVEVNGKHPRRAARVHELAADLGLPVVAGSDAHYPFEAGRAYTRVDADELTPASVVAAIRDGRVEPRVRSGPPQRLLRQAYEYIHRAKENSRARQS
jgi:predicted metal-dependent phosphoesterase TrpH